MHTAPNHLTRRIFLLSLCAAIPAQAEEKSPALKPLIITQTGTLPIILSAPHGGEAAIPGVPERKGEGLKRGGAGFFTGRDGGTEQLGLAISATIETRLGKKPYCEVAGFHRKFLDPNRPPEIAYEHPDARPVYESYHQSLARYAAEVKKTFGGGLLLDIHGQGVARDTVFRGTQNGVTVALLSRLHGPESHTGPKSLFGLLATEGFKVHPTGNGKEQPGFAGGYIVRTYGGENHFGIDAIQLEFGADFRALKNTKATAEKVADAVVAFSKLYLAEDKNRR